jgi:hypothetical protein
LVDDSPPQSKLRKRTADRAWIDIGAERPAFRRGDLAYVGGVGVHALGEHDLRKPDLAELGERALRSGAVTWQVHHHATPRLQFGKGLRYRHGLRPWIALARLGATGINGLVVA